MASTMQNEFAALITAVGKSSGGSREVGPTMSRQAMELLAFDIEQRRSLAETRVFVATRQGVETVPAATNDETTSAVTETSKLTAKQQEIAERMARQQDG